MKLTVMLEKDGAQVPVDINLDNSVANLIKAGMTAAAKADQTWSENFEAIVKAFWTEYSPASTDKVSDIKTALRDADAEYQTAYQAFVQLHPGYAKAMQAKAKMESLKSGTSEFDDAKHIFDGRIETCRNTARAQLRAVIGYFAKAFGADAVEASRKELTARLMIEAFRLELLDRISKANGDFKNAASRVLAHNCAEALKVELAKDLKALAENNQQNAIVPPPSVGAEGRAAGPVVTLTGEAAQAAVAVTE